MNPGGRGCTPAWVTERDSEKEKQARKKDRKKENEYSHEKILSPTKGSNVKDQYYPVNFQIMEIRQLCPV